MKKHQTTANPVVYEYTFRNVRTNDLKIVKIVLEDEEYASGIVVERNLEEYKRVQDKLKLLGWVRFPERYMGKHEVN